MRWEAQVNEKVEVSNYHRDYGHQVLGFREIKDL